MNLHPEDHCTKQQESLASVAVDGSVRLWSVPGCEEVAVLYDVSATYKIVGKLEYEARTDNWRGPFKIQVFDPDGNEIFADRGTSTGTRIAVETLD